MVKISIDERELVSGIPEELKALGVKIEVGNLETGDYVVGGEVVVERKTDPDFVASLLDLVNKAGKRLLNLKWVIYLY